jgi:hypothetical protein
VNGFHVLAGNGQAPFCVLTPFSRAYENRLVTHALLRGGDIFNLFHDAMRFAVSCGRSALAGSNTTCLSFSTGANFGAANGMRAHANA